MGRKWKDRVRGKNSTRSHTRTRHSLSPHTRMKGGQKWAGDIFDMDRGMGYPSQFILTSHTQNLTLSAYPYWPGMRAAGNLCRVARGRPGKKEKKEKKNTVHVFSDVQ